MSVNLSTAFIKSFDAQVKQSYQGEAKLLGAVRMKDGVVGETHRFTLIGKGLAQARGASQADITPMNVDYTNTTATLADYVAPEYTDRFDQAKVNFQEQRELVKVVSGAIGRRMDQIIIDAMNASNFSTNVDEDFGTTNSSLTVAKLRRAKRLLDQNGVPMTDRYLAHSAQALEGLLGETQATSADFNSVRALVSGEIDTFLGFKFIMIEDRSEGGLPLASNIRSNFAFHGGSLGSVGLAVGMRFRTEINYVPEKVSTLINGMFSAGAVTIDPQGVIEVQSYEA